MLASLSSHFNTASTVPVPVRIPPPEPVPVSALFKITDAGAYQQFYRQCRCFNVTFQNRRCRFCTLSGITRPVPAPLRHFSKQPNPVPAPGKNTTVRTGYSFVHLQNRRCRKDNIRSTATSVQEMKRDVNHPGHECLRCNLLRSLERLGSTSQTEA